MGALVHFLSSTYYFNLTEYNRISKPYLDSESLELLLSLVPNLKNFSIVSKSGVLIFFLIVSFLIFFSFVVNFLVFANTIIRINILTMYFDLTSFLKKQMLHVAAPKGMTTLHILEEESRLNFSRVWFYRLGLYHSSKYVSNRIDRRRQSVVNFLRNTSVLRKKSDIF